LNWGVSDNDGVLGGVGEIGTCCIWNGATTIGCGINGGLDGWTYGGLSGGTSLLSKFI